MSQYFHFMRRAAARHAILTIFAALLLPAGRAQAQSHWALVVGPSGTDSAPADARNIAAALHRDLGYDSDHICLLNRDPAPAGAPTRDGILDQLGKMAALMHPDDTFFFYYAGRCDGTGDGLALFTAEPNGTGRLKLSDLSAALRKLPVRQAMLVFDVAETAALDEPTATALKSLRVGPPENPADTALLLSCAPGQTSRAWDRPGQSAFAHFLIEGLADNATGPNGNISAFDLAIYLQAALANWSNAALHTASAQTPDFTGARTAFIDLGRPNAIARPDIPTAQADNSNAALPGIAVGKEITVSSTGKADYSTIAAAIDAAPANARIKVFPGYYPEPVAIHRPVEIVGAYADGQVEIGGIDPIDFKVDAPTVIFRNITLAFQHAPNRRGRRGIAFSGGTALMDRCILSSQRLGIMLDCGAGSLIMRGCTLDSDSGAVVLQDGGSGDLDGCTINRAQGAAIIAQPGSRLKMNRCHVTGVTGICLRADSARADIGDCQFDDIRTTFNFNGGAAMDFYGSQAKVSNCRIDASGRYAVYIDDSRGGGLSDVEMDHCSITNPNASDVIIANNAGAGLRECTLLGKTLGCFVQLGSTVELNDCDISGTPKNTCLGIEVLDATLHLSDGSVHNCNGSGCWFTAKGQGTIDSTVFSGLGASGIIIEGESNPTITSVHVNHNKNYGIWIRGKGAGTIEACDLRENALGAFDIETNCHPVLGNNLQ